MDQSLAEQLRALGVRRSSPSGRALLQAAELGYIKYLRCEMEECLYPEELGGRGYFEPIGGRLSDWIPTADHYPDLKEGRRATRGE